MCFLPLLVLSGLYQAKMLTGFANEDKNAMEAAVQVSITEQLQFRPTDIYSFSEKPKAAV